MQNWIEPSFFVTNIEPSFFATSLPKDFLRVFKGEWHLVQACQTPLRRLSYEEQKEFFLKVGDMGSCQLYQWHGGLGQLIQV